MEQKTINNHKVTIEDGAEKGYEYLKFDLQISESEVFFHEAKRMGRADFEDDQERNFTLSHNRDGSYSVARR